MVALAAVSAHGRSAHPASTRFSAGATSRWVATGANRPCPKRARSAPSGGVVLAVGLQQHVQLGEAAGDEPRVRPAPQCALRNGEQAVGVLFAVLAAETPPPPAELRTVGAFAELLAATIADRSRISALEDRLTRVREITAEP